MQKAVHITTFFELLQIRYLRHHCRIRFFDMMLRFIVGS
jgi:hypothetical protein